MTIEEIKDLLSVVAGYDQRTVGDNDIEAWRLALEDPRVPNIGLGECVDAVVLHYRGTSERIGPSHILKRLKAMRSDVLDKALPPAKPNPGAYAKVAALLDGRSRASRGECAANRHAVLAHADLSARLTELPIGYVRADQWSGFVPPAAWNGSNNGSARREALAALVDEAHARKGR